MPTLQTPLPSGYGSRTTAAEVIAGRDLTGTNIVVTGGYSGLGLETVRALAGAGAHVTVPARDRAKAEAALAPLEGAVAGTVVLDALDLASSASVLAFGTRYVASGRPLHILVNNAAIMANPLTRDADGHESQFATNHLGHFRLVGHLWPALCAAAGARVVQLSSTGHRRSPVRFDDIDFRTRPYEKWDAYGQSKSANSLFAVELDRRGQAFGVRAFAVHPGGIMTDLQRHLPRDEQIAMGWMDEAGNLNPLFKTPAQGAATSVWCATSPQLDGMGGVYCEDCDIAALVPADSSSWSGVRPYAIDPEAARALWALSEVLTGVRFP
ncbi:MAG TPA: SDR family NAD(P)-dependent oxidoreductase [Vicinamibacterales bacterium]|nr:SDR family NAD(P)-dependent oxidoreductase [Vicinamibacterales bacterium]